MYWGKYLGRLRDRTLSPLAVPGCCEQARLQLESPFVWEDLLENHLKTFKDFDIESYLPLICTLAQPSFHLKIFYFLKRLKIKKHFTNQSSLSLLLLKKLNSSFFISFLFPPNFSQEGKLSQRESVTVHVAHIFSMQISSLPGYHCW